jgi:hypothetical protein
VFSHTCLVAQYGVSIVELIALAELARGRIYEFAIIGGSFKLLGGDVAPLRVVTISSH